MGHLENNLWCYVVCLYTYEMYSFIVFLCDFVGRFMEERGSGKDNGLARDVAWWVRAFCHSVDFIFTYVLDFTYALWIA